MAGNRLRERAAVVVVREGRVLLVRQRGQRRFSLPGGGIRRQEPVVSAAAREVYEELRLEAVRVTRLPRYDHNGTANAHRVCLVEVKGEPILRRFEIDDFIWWDQKETVAVLPHVTSILSKMRAVLRKQA